MIVRIKEGTYKVPVSRRQAVTSLKGQNLNIGFAREREHNVNLPWQLPADYIYDHIQGNKLDSDIPEERCISAIQAIQNAIRYKQRCFRGNAA
jgi:hypothetical protein